MPIQPFLKVICPSQAGFAGSATLKVYKQNGDFMGETRVDCPSSQNTDVKYIQITGSGEPKNWRIDVTLTNNNTHNTKTQSFNGRYDMSQPNTTTDNTNVMLDGVTFTAGTGWR